jgi:O-succinylhomoserine sulfhydrylase
MKKDESNLIRIQSERSQHREHSTPIYLTSSFTFDNAEQGRALFAEEENGNIYSRFSNPNNSEFINKMVQLEKGEGGFAFASGMAAVFAGFASLLSSGDHVLTSQALFGSTHQIFKQILPRWGISSTYIDAGSNSNWEKAIKNNTKMIFVETPSNPGLELVDLEFVSDIAKKHDLLLHVDNTFATPLIQKPIDFGADLVSHSATKYIDGQGRTIGGIIVGRNDLLKEIRFFARQTGASLSPFNAWVLSKSLETLSLRIEKHSSNALQLAAVLENNHELDFVRYPHLPSHPQYELAKRQMVLGGGIITMVVVGGIKRAKKFIDSIKMASSTANLGDTRTIITHPASTTHSKLTDDERALVGISPGLIRISVGLENVDDIKDDIYQALEESKGRRNNEN